MGSLLGMSKQNEDKNDVKQNEKKDVVPIIEEKTVPEEMAEEIMPKEKKNIIPYEEEIDKEYIPIENIRIRRRDEKEMKVPVSFSLSRKTAEQLKQIAYVERLSSSEIVSGLIEAYIHAHQDVLIEYKDLLRRRK
ncbi:MAG: hypothetical protein IKI84_06090 [Clostridia bacterium]|nr:hypothetical protein [Clostridia bacterium]